MCQPIRRAALLLLFSLAAPAWAAERAIEKEVIVNATPTDVWNAWTTKAGITSFFAPDAVVDAKAGGACQIHIDPLAQYGMKGERGGGGEKVAAKRPPPHAAPRTPTAIASAA